MGFEYNTFQGIKSSLGVIIPCKCELLKSDICRYFNEIELPVFMRIPGFKLYAWIFGADISEASESDLRNYRNLAEFFYRQLKPGVRPIDEDAILVSPSDGKVLHFGTVLPGGEVSNVKGMTYSLDALLGTRSEDEFTGPSEEPPKPEKVKKGSWWKFWKWGSKDGGSLLEVGDMDVDQKFAVVNGISYTLPGLLSGDKHEQHSGANQAHGGKPADVSLPPSELPNTTDVDAVKADLDAGKPGWWSPAIQESNKALYFCVIYLAPGDYHRFHSPANWVVERRRHFAGELFSVSPYLQSKLANLFVLNERVVLIGRWRHGLFTMTPVGATNVGSIKIHFDKELRTNSLTHDATAADTHPEEGYAEAVYRSASKVLGGHPLVKGAEIGGFNLGSTIVLVFEAPAGDEEFQWDIKPLQKIKMGERLGSIRKKGVEEQTKADW